MNRIESIATLSRARHWECCDEPVDYCLALLGIDDDAEEAFDMIDQLQKAFQRLLSESARSAAEHRLAYHLEHDTLDLY